MKKSEGGTSVGKIQCFPTILQRMPLISLGSYRAHSMAFSFPVSDPTHHLYIFCKALSTTDEAYPGFVAAPKYNGPSRFTNFV